MNIQTVGLVSNFLKTMSLEKKWQERKRNPLLEKGTERERQIAAFKQQTRDSYKAQSLAVIDSKMKSGVLLSGAEMEYLRKNAPETYKKAVEIEREREAYKKSLKKCRSKEEVARLNTQKLNQFVAQARAVSSNPNIPNAKKQEALEFIQMRAAAIQNEYIAFRQTEQYKNLPEKDETVKNRKLHIKISNDEWQAANYG